MARIRPKEILERAKQAESRGERVEAGALYSQLGVYFLHRERYAEARGAFQRATKLDPMLVDSYFRWAVAEVRSGNEAGARLAMTQFTRAALRERIADKYTWRIENELARYPKLRQSFYEALLLVDRTSAAPFIGLARAHRDASEGESARRALLDGLKTKSHDREILEALRAMIKGGGTDQEMEYLDSFERGELERLDFIALLERSSVPMTASDDTQAGDKDLETLITELEKEIGLKEESLDTAEPLILEFRKRSQSILKGDSKARIDMATAYFEMGLYVAAREELLQIQPEDRRYGEARCLLGEVLVAEGSLLEALETYQNCRRTDEPPGNLAKECEYRMIQIYLRLGDRKQAVIHVRELEKIDQNYRDFKSLRTEVMASLDGVADRMLRETPRRASGK